MTRLTDVSPRTRVSTSPDERETSKRLLSVVIPALNEYHNLERVVAGIPVGELLRAGWDTEIVIVDNGSTDGTGDKARALGAKVVVEPRRGYGSAYLAGLAAASGEAIATGDADLTYPLDALPALLALFLRQDVQFLTTNRLIRSNRSAMKRSHMAGNLVLSATSRMLFGHDFRDSQSGMWIFLRSAWETMDVRSTGMAFSQEIKNEAYARGLRCLEARIEYRARGGQVKLNSLSDGLANLLQLFAHHRRLRAPGQVAPVGAAGNVYGSPRIQEPGGEVEPIIDVRTAEFGDVTPVIE